ncbi:hypothetical protein [Alishewanella tabrizica]|uniref:hypothetical protein n=1 Tax=Alishewanella tabrizica TaxID=671278 RepID=UPI001676EC43|nr:hypothetical protein [Alishewanella tabrizica]
MRKFLLISVIFLTSSLKVLATEFDCKNINSAQEITDNFERTSNWKKFHKPKEYALIGEFPAEYINQFYYQPGEPHLEDKIISDFDESLANEAGVKIAIRVRYLGHDKNENRALVSEYVIPGFYFEVAEGIIAGSDRGEFGGDLFFIDRNKKVLKLADINVQDIFKFGSSYVVVSGLDHLGFEYGKLHLLNFSEGKPIFELFFNLTGSPKKLIRINSDSLLLKFRRNSYLFNIKGILSRVACE